MFKKISHIGVAVKDIKASKELFSKLFGKAPEREEDLPEHKVKTAIFNIGESSIELTEAMDSESPIMRFIAARGEGVHHVSFVVDDIEKELARLRDAGFQLVDERPRPGADGYLVAFLHPRSTNGVLIEISQQK